MCRLYQVRLEGGGGGAEWPSYGKELLARFTVVLSNNILNQNPVIETKMDRTRVQDFGSNCTGS